LVALPNEPYDIISKKWLNNWLKCKSSADLKPVDNNKLLCVHSKLSLKSLSSFKCISTIGADQIYRIYGGGPRLNRDSLCRICVSKQIDIVKTRTKLDEDQKFISSQFRFKPDDDSYWVGKDSLKSWKQIKMKSIENDYSNENGIKSLKHICPQILFPIIVFKLLIYSLFRRFFQF
jgi:ubiquitin carboxyl-terminal hydrolase 48